MSEPDLKSFLKDLQKDPAGLEALRNLLVDPEAVVRWAEARGYRLTREQAEQLAETDQELPDEDLEQVAGGDDGWGSGSPPPGSGGGP